MRPAWERTGATRSAAGRAWARGAGLEQKGKPTSSGGEALESCLCDEPSQLSRRRIGQVQGLALAFNLQTLAPRAIDLYACVDRPVPPRRRRERLQEARRRAYWRRASKSSLWLGHLYAPISTRSRVSAVSCLPPGPRERSTSLLRHNYLAGARGDVPEAERASPASDKSRVGAPRYIHDSAPPRDPPLRRKKPQTSQAQKNGQAAKKQVAAEEGREEEARARPVRARGREGRGLARARP